MLIIKSFETVMYTQIPNEQSSSISQDEPISLWMRLSEFDHELFSALDKWCWLRVKFSTTLIFKDIFYMR